MIPFGVAQETGLRPRMEDAHAIRDLPERSFFSAEVYDGHLGYRAAQTAARILTPHYLHIQSRESKRAHGGEHLDSELLRQAYLWTDSQIVAEGEVGGTSAATLYFHGDRFLAANVGDVAVFLGAEDGPLVLSQEHKPHLPQERARIESLGGVVIFLDVPRVQGMLAISRALGDPQLKPFVTPEPLITEGRLGRDNDFAVVACDGVWNVLRQDEAMAMARGSGSPQEAADWICREALERWTTDNVTVIVLDLRSHCGNLPWEEAQVLGIWDRGKSVSD